MKKKDDKKIEFHCIRLKLPQGGSARSIRAVIADVNHQNKLQTFSIRYYPEDYQKHSMLNRN